MDKRIKGWVAESMAAVGFIEDGYEVSRPIIDCLPYDLLVVKDNVFSRVQIKSLRKSPTGFLSMSLTRGTGIRNRRFYTHSVELFIAVDIETRSMWLIPHDGINGINGKSSISMIGLTPWKNPPPTPSMPLPTRRTWFSPPLNPLKSHTTVSKVRLTLKNIVPIVKPQNIQEEDWELLTKYMEGYGCKSLAAEYDVSKSTVKYRIDKIAKLLSS